MNTKLKYTGNHFLFHGIYMCICSNILQKQLKITKNTFSLWLP
uniref:Uncharacterized protein n=1 Tax=Anguilla anguilla TaxID=7936 RepID=A0A0E9RIY3_ANGAN